MEGDTSSKSAFPIAASRETYFVLASGFQFISFPNPTAPRNEAQHRLVHSHCARQMHLERRQRLVQRQENFRLVTCKEIRQTYASKPNRKRVAPRTPVSSLPSSLPTPLSSGIPDPFDTLAVDSSRLQSLLGHCEWFLRLLLERRHLNSRQQAPAKQ
jgi:hypothetical protein